MRIPFQHCSAIVFRVLLTSNLFYTATPGFLLCGLEISLSPFCLRYQQNLPTTNRRVILSTEKETNLGFFDLKLCLAQVVALVSNFKTGDRGWCGRWYVTRAGK